MSHPENSKRYWKNKSDWSSQPSYLRSIAIMSCKRCESYFPVQNFEEANDFLLMGIGIKNKVGIYLPFYEGITHPAL